MNQRKNTRAAIYTMAGFYLIYLAYKLFRGNGEQAGTEKIIGMAAMVLFAVVGAGLAYFGLRSGIEGMKGADSAETEAEEPAEESAEEETEAPEEESAEAAAEPEPDPAQETAQEPEEAGEDSKHN